MRCVSGQLVRVLFIRSALGCVLMVEYGLEEEEEYEHSFCTGGITTSEKAGDARGIIYALDRHASGFIHICC